MDKSSKKYNDYDLHVTEKILILDGKIDKKIAEVNGKISESFAKLDGKIDGKFNIIINKIDGYSINTTGCLRKLDEHSKEIRDNSVMIQNMDSSWRDIIKKHDDKIDKHSIDLATMKTESKSRSAWVAVVLTAMVNGVLFGLKYLFSGGHK